MDIQGSFRSDLAEASSNESYASSLQNKIPDRESKRCDSEQGKRKDKAGNGNKLSVPFPESNDSDEWRVRFIMPLGVNCEARPPSELQRANGRRGQLVLAQ